MLKTYAEIEDFLNQNIENLSHVALISLSVIICSADEGKLEYKIDLTNTHKIVIEWSNSDELGHSILVKAVEDV